MTSKAASKVLFHFLQTRPPLKNRIRLKRFLEDLFKKENKGLNSLHYIFCPDDYLLKINREFLGHDYLTDIVSFELSESEKSEGEIYISIDRVRENARQYGATLTEELHRVIFHGALHLCGYQDKTARDQGIMRDMENKYLQKYFRKRST